MGGERGDRKRNVIGRRRQKTKCYREKEIENEMLQGEGDRKRRVTEREEYRKRKVNEVEGYALKHFITLTEF